MKDTFFYSKKTLNVKGNLIDLSSPLVMGIMNSTPDSFYEASRTSNEEEWISKAGLLLQEGADIIDIGGYSTRPGASDITEAEELSRVIPAIKIIHKKYPKAILSIDTFRSNVAKEAIKAGAGIINDISGGSLDPVMFDTAAELKVPYILSHIKGTPQNMTSYADYENLIEEILDYFILNIEILKSKNVTDIILDPGFGFAKTPLHNFELLRKLNYLKILKLPILVGLSRKSMIYKTLNIDPKDSLNGTTVVNTMALMNGADIIRVHDVKECKEAIQLYKSVYH